MRSLVLLTLLFALLPAPLAPAAPESDWTIREAAHLLRRAGFGGTPAQVASLHALGRTAAVDRLLDWEGKPDPDRLRLRITVTSRPSRAEYVQAETQEARQRIRREYRRRDVLQYSFLREWWMHTMIRTAHPLRERLTLFWHGHFTSSFRDVRNSYHLYIQNTLFRRHAAGNFRTLLHAVSKDPAMLEYLDNNRNRRGRPNENYAREVMELFTLGVGHYTEKDIREAARALTGWTFRGNRFVFDEHTHDDGPKTIFGKTASLDGGQFLDLVLEQPAASRHIARRLFSYFAHADPSDAVVENLAKALRDHDWELKPVLRRLFLSPAFYSRRAMGSRVKSPVELVVGLFRQLGMSPDGHYGLPLHAARLGQSLFDPPNVKGWPGGRAWITTSHLLNRYNICGALVGLPQDTLRSIREGGRSARRAAGMAVRMQRAQGDDAPGMDSGLEMDGAKADDTEDMGPSGKDGDAMEPDRRRGRGAGRGRGRRLPPSFDVLRAVKKADLDTAPKIVDHFLRSLLAVQPSAELRATLLTHLQAGGGFALDRADARARLHSLLRLIVSAPEFQLT